MLKYVVHKACVRTVLLLDVFARLSYSHLYTTEIKADN
jgi:hypothetical protein